MNLCENIFANALNRKQIKYRFKRDTFTGVLITLIFVIVKNH